METSGDEEGLMQRFQRDMLEEAASSGMGEALRARLKLLREVYDHSPHGYLITDGAGMIQFANRVAAELLHLELKFLTGKPIFVFVHQDERMAFLTDFVRLKRNGHENISRWPVTLQPRRVPAVRAELTVSFVRSCDGNLIGVSWLIRCPTSTILPINAHTPF
jgi:PAS domain S-box-containing protein